ncbi:MULTISPECIES: endonuclease/exonuclease/phosphatase family protein [unclassified Kribbella]|uniref:endonuclease/exonuclease/phosphatase family protein n=1 Tax=unclassified Kribbella TaxID=2644121 RepID=UPI00301624FE
MHRSLASRLTGLAAALTLLAIPLHAAPAAAEPDKPVSVMTRNIYLGADIQRPIRATAGLTGAAAFVALGNANHVTRAIVDQTNFPRRSELLAAEIAGTKPDLIGVQEVALWRHGPLELPGAGSPGALNATTVDYDFLAILLQDLRRAGVPYKAVVVQQESDVEAPAFVGNPFTGTATQGRDVRLTIRDVILLRASSNLRVLDSGSGQYDARLVLNVAGLPASFVRGFNWVDVAHGSGRPFRFVNTHLEAFSSDLALAQAVELLTGPAGDRGLTTIIGCDCNSDPLNSTVKPTDPLRTPHNGPYNFITGPGGFTDLWLTWRPAERGWTSGLNETVDEPAPPSFDHRIDLILARPAPGEQVRVIAGDVTGATSAAKDPVTGLWPSDHAGVVLTLSR